jgi:hypothetical protein
MSRMLHFRPRVLLRFAACLLASALPGCISYTLDRLPPAGELPAPIDPARRPSASYAVRSSTGSGYQVPGKGSPAWGLRDPANEFADALRDSGQFRSVEPASPDTQVDLQLEVVLTVDANDMLLAASALTLFVIPTWRTVNFELVAEARASDGRWKRYELSDAARDINWLPLILGMSFAPWGSAYFEVRKNLYDTLLLRLHEDGLLAPAGAASVSASPPGDASSSG